MDQLEQMPLPEEPENSEPGVQGVTEPELQTEMENEPAPVVPEQTPSAEEAPVTPEKKKVKKPWVKKLLKRVALVLGLLVLVAAVAAATCYVTTRVVEAYWQEQMVMLNQVTDEKIALLEEKLEDAVNDTPLLTAPVEEGLSPGQVYEYNLKTVVSVINYQTVRGAKQAVSTGTGFFFSSDGYIITNYHVIEGAESVTITTHDDQVFDAAIVGYESGNDLAVLKVEGEGFPCVIIGSSDDLKVGDQVVAIGNALGQLHSTMTVGYISAKDQLVATDGSAMSMLQTDAAINSGNSGGPLFNMRGELVGITTSKYSGYTSSGATIEGIGFAIPIDDVLRQIRDLQQYGYVTGAYLGVSVQEIDTTTAQMYGLPKGIRVVEVVPGAAAERAGIQVGDLITNFGGYDIGAIAELSRALRRFEAGEVTSISVFREGQVIHLEITLDEKPREEKPMPEGNSDDWYDYFSGIFGNEEEAE